MIRELDRDMVMVSDNRSYIVCISVSPKVLNDLQAKMGITLSSVEKGIQEMRHQEITI